MLIWEDSQHQQKTVLLDKYYIYLNFGYEGGVLLWSSALFIFFGHQYYKINNDGEISKINYAIVSMLVWDYSR